MTGEFVVFVIFALFVEFKPFVVFVLFIVIFLKLKEEIFVEFSKLELVVRFVKLLNVTLV